MSNARLNIHMYPSPFVHETRILRITKSLADRGVFDEILVIAALREAGLQEHERLDRVRSVWRVPSRIDRRNFISKVLATVEWYGRTLSFLYRSDVTCLNAHSLPVLPLAVLTKFLKGCRLVYDAHEIETEMVSLSWARKALFKVAEAFCMPYVDVVALTSDGHGEWYRRRYRRDNVRVIKNFPYSWKQGPSSGNVIRTKFGIPEEAVVYLYQGLVAESRGTDLLLRVFARLEDAQKHIVFRAFGDIDRVLEYARRHRNIHYHPTVPPGEIALFTSYGDVGIYMMEGTCLNYVHGLPNKPMEYLNAGVPAIVSDLPEVGKLIRESGAGWVVPYDERGLESLIRCLSRDEMAERAARARAWAETHTWEREEESLFRMYQEFDLGRKARRSRRGATST